MPSCRFGVSDKGAQSIAAFERVVLSTTTKARSPPSQQNVPPWFVTLATAVAGE
jgi:hypothetical protein